MNQLDHEKVILSEVVRELQSQFGNKVIPVQYPLATGLGFNSIVDVLSKNFTNILLMAENLK